MLARRKLSKWRKWKIRWVEAPQHFLSYECNYVQLRVVLKDYYCSYDFTMLSMCLMQAFNEGKLRNARWLTIDVLQMKFKISISLKLCSDWKRFSNFSNIVISRLMRSRCKFRFDLQQNERQLGHNFYLRLNAFFNCMLGWWYAEDTLKKFSMEYLITTFWSMTKTIE